MATELGVAYVSIVPSAKGLTAAVQKEMGAPLAAAATQAGSKASQSFSSAFAAGAKRTSALGDSLTLGLTAPLVGLGALAVSASVKFESAFAGVRKTVQATEPELAALRQGILDMAQELPTSREEIAAVAEAAGALGIQTPNILGFTRTMIDLGNATDLTSDQAATALARISNVMGTAQTDFDNLGSALVDLGNNGASTEAEITEMATRIAGAGKVVGLTEGDVLGFASALASVGVEAEAGGSAISRVMVEVANSVADGGEKLDEFARIAGVSSADFKQAFETDAAGAIITFIEGLGRIQGEGENVFATLEGLELQDIRVRNALLLASGAGDLFRESITRGNTAFQENTALAKEANERYATTESQFRIAANRASEMARQVGDVLAPALLDAVQAAEPLVDFIGTLASGFAALPSPIQTTIIALLGFTAAAGPLMAIGGRLAGALSQLVTGFMGMGPAGAIALGAAVALGGVYIGLQAKKKQLTDQTNKYVTALTAEAGGQKDALKAAVAADLANREIAESAEAAGISVAEMARVIKGENVPAFEDLKAAIEESFKPTVPTDFIESRFGQSRDEAIRFVQQIERMQLALGLAEEDVARLGAAQEELGVSTGASTDETAKAVVQWAQAAAAAQSAGAGAETAATGFETWKASIDETKTATDNLLTVLAELAGGQAGLDASVSALNAAYDEAAATLLRNIAAQEEAAAGSGDLARTLDLTTEAGRSNQEALAGIASAGQAAASGFLEVHDDAAGAKLVLQQARDEFVKSAREMGLTEDAANKLADQYGLIPKNVDTAVKITGHDKAKADAAGVQGAVTRVPTNRTTTFNADTGTFFTAADAVRAAIEKIPRSRTTVLRAVTAAFHSGGIVPGPKGKEVPILALGGEWVINPDKNGVGEAQPFRPSVAGPSAGVQYIDARGAVIASDTEFARLVARVQRVGDRVGVRR